MNWEQIESNWQELKGQVRGRWGKFTDDDLERIAGNKEIFADQLQEKYGFAKLMAHREVERFARELRAVSPVAPKADR